jgi:hypothetical protein
MRKVKVVLVDVGEYDAVYFKKNFPLIANVEGAEAEILELTGDQAVEALSRHTDTDIVVVQYEKNHGRQELVTSIISVCPTTKVVGLIFHIDWKLTERDGCAYAVTTPHHLPFFLPKQLGFPDGEDLIELTYGKWPNHVYLNEALYGKLKSAGVIWRL